MGNIWHGNLDGFLIVCLLVLRKNFISLGYIASEFASKFEYYNVSMTYDFQLV